VSPTGRTSLPVLTTVGPGVGPGVTGAGLGDTVGEGVGPLVLGARVGAAVGRDVEPWLVGPTLGVAVGPCHGMAVSGLSVAAVGLRGQ
jgi:hypothetical protein